MDSVVVGMCVHNDYDIARDAIKSVWNNTPYGMFVIDDGGYDKDFHKFCDENYVDYQSGDRLYPLSNGGAWLDRLLNYYIKHYPQYGYLMKIDTDTRVWDELYIPDGVKVMGQKVIDPRTDWVFLAGGCRVISRDTADTIVQSGVLSDECYKHRPFDYTRHRLSDGEILASEDRIFAHVCDRLGIPKTPTTQFHLNWTGHELPFDTGMQYVASHPHYGNYYQ